METFILKNLKDGISAVVDYYPKYDSIKTVYNIRCTDSGIYKLVAMSSLKPSFEPMIVDTPEFKNSFAQGNREITSRDSSYKGYRLSDIDTFVLAQKTPEGFLPVAVHFCRLAWDFGANEFFLPSFQTEESIRRAQKVLDSIKTASDSAVFDKYVQKLNFFKTLFKKSHLSPLDSFEWYEVCCKSHIEGISAYRHALGQLDKKISFLWGVKDDGITALAVKSDLNFSFPNVSDCVIKCNDYYVVGVVFRKEGQYFAKIPE